MNVFVSFYDYANNIILDEEYPECITILPEVGDSVSWLDPRDGRYIAKVINIKYLSNEMVFEMGRPLKVDSIDMSKAVSLGVRGLDHEFIIKASR
jgi:hypothetical protein